MGTSGNEFIWKWNNAKITLHWATVISLGLLVFAIVYLVQDKPEHSSMREELWIFAVGTFLITAMLLYLSKYANIYYSRVRVLNNVK